MGREFVLGKLPEDIFDRLYSLVPLEDAARAACVSRGFLHSWRRYPRLVFNYKTLGLDRFWKTEREDTLALTERDREYKIESYLVYKIDHVLKKRSDIAVVKAFILHLHPCPNIEASYIDKWLQFALKPGIEELELQMSLLEKRAEYNFPCSLLSNETGGSPQSLRLSSCAFHPRTALGCHKSLTSLDLSFVHITGKELGHLVSNCHALAKLFIYGCNGIIYFRVPGVLWHLNHFHVIECKKLRVIEINAPKLSSFACGENLPQISLGATEVKDITMSSSQPNTICYARTNLLLCQQLKELP